MKAQVSRWPELAFSGSSRLEEVSWLNEQGLGEAIDVVDRHVALAFLDRHDVCPMQVRPFAKLILREAEFVSQPTHVRCNALA